MKRDLIALSLLIAVVLPALAQQDRGTITGTITDTSGAVIPGARVTVRKVETNALYRTSTTGSGQYVMPNLPIGAYDVTFEANGFRKAGRSGIDVGIAQTVRVDARLEVGAATESIEVRAEVSVLQVDKPDVGTSIESAMIKDLPLSFEGGRTLENFAYSLTPGVQGDSWTSRINGSLAVSKEVLLDGASVTMFQAGAFGENSPSMEAVEEFKVQTSGLSAEFGRTGGGVFNFVMKSGTNRVHGSAMGLLRNEWMDANSFANNYYGRAKGRDRRNNWALSLGGPIELPKLYHGKNKTFFYATYERYHEDNGQGFGSPNVTVPIPEWYDGNLSRYLTSQVLGQDALGRDVIRGAIYDPSTSRTAPNGILVRDMFPGNIIPKSRMSVVSGKVFEIMKAHYLPTVKQPDGQYALVNNSFFPLAQTPFFDQKQFSLKLDHNVSDRQKLSGAISYVDRPRQLLDYGGVWDPAAPAGGPLSRMRIQNVRTKMARLSHDYILRSNLLQHFTLGVNRNWVPSLSAHQDDRGAKILGISNIEQNTAFPDINWGGGDRVSFPIVGFQNSELMAGTSWNLADTVTWIKGRHSLKFGFDHRKNGMNRHDDRGPAAFNFGASQTGLPGFSQSGTPFASMFLGLVSNANVNLDTPMGSRTRYFGAFIQDDFKVSRKLTLNLGLRWEYQPPQREVADRISDYCTTCIDPYTGLPGTLIFAGSGNGRTGKRDFVNGQWNDFGPRIGLAYRVRTKMAFRAAYTINYFPRVPNDWYGAPNNYRAGYGMTSQVNDTNNLTAAFNWDNGYPGTVTYAKLDPSLPNYATNAIANPVWWDPNGGKVPYLQQWNANFQFDLPFRMVLDIGYLGNKSTGIYSNQLTQLNQMPTSALKLGDKLALQVRSQADIPAEALALGARYPYGNAAVSIPLRQTLQPFPQLRAGTGIVAWGSPVGFATFNALELSLNKRLSHGLSWLASYTLSKTLSNADSDFNTGANSGHPLDYNNLKLEKSIAPFDQTHFVKIGASYELPVGKGRRFGSRMPRGIDLFAGGWKLHYIGNYSSGTPLGFASPNIPNFNGSTNRANVAGGQPLGVPWDPGKFDMSAISVPGTSSNMYLNTQAIQAPQDRYSFGTSAYRLPWIRGFSSFNEDASLQKNFRVNERLRLQVRAEFLNLLNRHRYGINTSTTGTLFGQVASVNGGYYRKTQIGVRADF